MRLDGLSVKNFHDKKKDIKKGISRRFTVVLTNKEGDRITVTTNNPRCKELVVGEDVSMTLIQEQQKIESYDEETEDGIQGS